MFKTSSEELRPLEGNIAVVRGESKTSDEQLRHPKQNSKSYKKEPKVTRKISGC
jgi:hypothetical protein